MKIIRQNQLSPEEKEAVLHLWNTEYPERFFMPEVEGLDDFLDTVFAKTYYLLLTGDNAVAGCATAFNTGPERSFFIIVDSTYHGKGYGSLLLDHVKQDNPRLFAWAIDHNEDIKADGRPYPSPVQFYLKNGFTVNEDLRLENELLSAVNILWEKE